MTFARALSAEALKMKRTIALKMVLIAPIAVVLFTLFITSQAPFTSLNRATAPDPWKVLARINLQFWGLLMLPLYVTLQTALIASIDHAENQWKALFARPVPRWTAYIAKLLVVMAMIAVSAVILVLGIWGEGRLLDWFDSELGFAKTAPLALIGGQAAQMTGLAFLFLTIQHWVSLRWRSFSIAVGFGAVATVANIATLLAAGPYGGWPQYFPWSLPTLVIARTPQNIDSALWLGALAGLGTMVLGCADFCRREIQ